MTDYIVITCLFLLAGAYLYATAKLPVFKSVDPMGSKAFPLLLGIALALSAALLLVEIIHAEKQVNEKEQEPQNGIENTLIIIGAVILWTIVFFLLFERLGYIISTILYILPLMIYFNPKRWFANCFASVLFPISVYILFVKLLGVMLPKGIIDW